MIGLLYKADPNACRHEYTFLPRLWPYPVIGHWLQHAPSRLWQYYACNPGKRPHCHQPHCLPTGLAEIWEERHLDNCTCREVTADTCSSPAWLYVPSCRERLCHADTVVANHRRHSASQCISSGLPMQNCHRHPLLVQVLCMYLRRT